MFSCYKKQQTYLAIWQGMVCGVGWWLSWNHIGLELLRDSVTFPSNIIYIFRVMNQVSLCWATLWSHYMDGGAGCMAALDAEHYLQEIGSQEGKSD